MVAADRVHCGVLYRPTVCRRPSRHQRSLTVQDESRSPENKNAHPGEPERARRGNLAPQK